MTTALSCTIVDQRLQQLVGPGFGSSAHALIHHYNPNIKVLIFDWMDGWVSGRMVLGYLAASAIQGSYALSQ